MKSSNPLCPYCQGIMKLSWGYHGLGELKADIDLICEKCGIVLNVAKTSDHLPSRLIKLNSEME